MARTTSIDREPELEAEGPRRAPRLSVVLLWDGFLPSAHGLAVLTAAGAAGGTEVLLVHVEGEVPSGEFEAFPKWVRPLPVTNAHDATALRREGALAASGDLIRFLTVRQLEEQDASAPPTAAQWMARLQSRQAGQPA